MSHLGRLFSRSSAHKAGRRVDPDPPEIETVGVPTGSNGRIIGMLPIRMPGTGIDKSVKPLVLEIKNGTAQRCRIVCSTPPVVGVGPFADPTGIVEPGKEPHNKEVTAGSFSEPYPVALDSPPV